MPEKATIKFITLETKRSGDCAVVRCHGRLVSGGTDILLNEVKPLIPESKRIVLDLTDLEYIDSTGLGTLVTANGQGEMQGKIFRVAHLGYFDYLDTVAFLAAAEHIAKDTLGLPVEFGQAVAAAQRVFAAQAASS